MRSACCCQRWFSSSLSQGWLSGHDWSDCGARVSLYLAESLSRHSSCPGWDHLHQPSSSRSCWRGWVCWDVRDLKHHQVNICHNPLLSLSATSRSYNSLHPSGSLSLVLSLIESNLKFIKDIECLVKYFMPSHSAG